jgi:hypothetical protein
MSSRDPDAVRVLVVSHCGLEVAPFVEGVVGADTQRTIHQAQSWREVVCHCGDVHRATLPAWLTISVGEDDRSRGYRAKSLVIAVSRVADVTHPTIVADPCADFRPWARAVVRAHRE